MSISTCFEYKIKTIFVSSFKLIIKNIKIPPISAVEPSLSRILTSAFACINEFTTAKCPLSLAMNIDN